MEYGKFIISGEDKKTLACVKNALVSSGHIFIGYSKDYFNILRHIRNSAPELVIIDVGKGFKDLKQTLETIDEDLLCACVLILDTKSDDIFEFIQKSRVMTYISKPVFEEAIVQITDAALINYSRILQYEEKVKKLNETLESRKAVEKAKWILVEKEGLSEAEAYEAIRKKSRDNRVPMKNIAEALILTRG